MTITVDEMKTWSTLGTDKLETIVPVQKLEELKTICTDANNANYDDTRIITYHERAMDIIRPVFEINDVVVLKQAYASITSENLSYLKHQLLEKIIRLSGSMTVKQLYDTMIQPFYRGKVIVIQDGEIVYEGFPKETSIYAFLMVLEIKEIYCTYDEMLAIRVSDSE